MTKSIFDGPYAGGPSEAQIECLKRMQRKNKINIMFSIVFAVTSVVVLGFLVRGYVKCTARGSDYVRTVFWYTCIEKK